MTDVSQPHAAHPAEMPIPAGMPFADAVEAEHVGWYKILDLVRTVTPDECMLPGDYTDPDGRSATWSRTSAPGSPRPPRSSSA